MMSRNATRSYGFMIPALGLIAGFCLATADMRHALLVYLACWLFVLGVVLGSMTLLMIHALTGGDWGVRLGHALRAATRLFPYAALAVIPLLVGMHALFPWLQSAAQLDDPYLDRQHGYLNAPALIVRTIVVLAIWAWLAYGLIRRRAIGQRFAAVGMIAMLLSVTIAAVDWVMSLVPRWHSTDIALLLFTSQLLIALALAVFVHAARSTSAQRPPRRTQHDFANLLLVMVLGWAYVSFMDYLTTWIADQPAENAWYIPRLMTDWWWVGVALACLGLGVPLLTLLSGRAKASRRVLCAIALLSLFVQWLNMIWLVLPSVARNGVVLAWTDPLLCVGLLGLCALRYRSLLGDVAEDST